MAKLSRQPGLQNPTVKPLYVVSESLDTGFPDRGQNLLIVSSISNRS
ncbi:hypothetical protein [Winogradskyella sp.]